MKFLCFLDLASIAWGRFWLVFVIVIAAMAGLMLLRSVFGWWHIRKLGSDIGMGEFLALTWRGVKVSRIAAAEWMASQANLSEPIPRTVWVSFAMLRIDILKLAAAVVAAAQCGISASVGILGAAALSGYDPVDLVKEARDRGLAAIDSATLNELANWAIQRQDSPV